MIPRLLLDRLVYAITHEVNYYSQFNQSKELINQDYEIIDRELKALEIIKKYISMNRAFKNLANKESSNLTLVEIKALIPDKEYELLKEVLK